MEQLTETGKMPTADCLMLFLRIVINITILQLPHKKICQLITLPEMPSHPADSTSQLPAGFFSTFMTSNQGGCELHEDC